MSDQILRKLMLAFDTVVLRRESSEVFEVVTSIPAWFSRFCVTSDDGRLISRLRQESSFLQYFLEEAEAFWQEHHQGELRSGPFDEKTGDGRTGRLEAVAYALEGERLLTLTKRGSEHRGTRRLLQQARDAALAFEKLGKTQEALQRSEKQNLALISRLEAQHANLVAVLNQLRVGTMLLDSQGSILLSNRSCQRFLGLGESETLGRDWRSVLPLPEPTKIKLSAMLIRPAEERTRLSTSLVSADDCRYWMELDVQDDPSHSDRRMIFFYDVSEVQDLQRLIGERSGQPGILGESEPMRRLHREINDLGRLNTTVLIQGETGTGKELVARELHTLSDRTRKPFIAVNCAGLSESLLSSQLFGHRKGAFTGAVADQQGLFEAAQGGTLFLDEIGDMSLSIQASLLRVLQEREITRLGETKPRRIDVRLITATHRNLDEEVANGRFRSDLLYRIRVGRIVVPPLKERGGDLLLLSNASLLEFRRAIEKPISSFSPDAKKLLQQYTWPGNVRELRSAVEYAVIRCRGGVIQPDDLPPEVCRRDASTPGFGPEPTAFPHATPANDKERLLWALERTGGNRTEAARLLGISRATFYRRLTDHGLRRG